MRDISVLAIDDDEVDLESLRRNLTQCEGYRVQFRGFQNWQRGLEEHSARPADIIFLDFFLGNTTGTELLQALRGSGDIRPVIMLTGNGDEGTAKESIRYGASDYIAKSLLTPEVLIRSIEAAHREYQLRMENAYLEKELRAARHLEAIGTLAGGVAHDFNNFLAGILSSAELAQTYESAHEVARELDRITGIVKNASEVIRRLLQFNKYYAGESEMGSIDVREVVRDTFQILEHACPKGIDMEVCCDSDEAPYVIGSSARMHQILLNICVNAIEAMESEGHLRVAVARLSLSEGGGERPVALPAGEYVLLTVADTGPGIPDDVKERMFDPFFTTKKFGTQKGTGLGLATVWDCVHDMGGAIRVESVPEQGSIFRIYLPASEPDQPPPSPPARVSDCRGTETLLLVDDDSDARHTTTGLLRRLGYTVHSVGSGLEAITLLEAHSEWFDLIVLDVSMPGMDGLEVLQRVRAAWSGIPVIMATGHSATQTAEKVRTLGADGIVQKPFAIRALAVEIRKALRVRTRETR